MEKKELSRRRRKAEKGGLRGRSREGREREKKDKNTISKRTRIENVKAKSYKLQWKNQYFAFLRT